MPEGEPKNNGAELDRDFLVQWISQFQDDFHLQDIDLTTLSDSDLQLFHEVCDVIPDANGNLTDEKIAELTERTSVENRPPNSPENVYRFLRGRLGLGPGRKRIYENSKKQNGSE